MPQEPGDRVDEFEAAKPANEGRESKTGVEVALFQRNRWYVVPPMAAGVAFGLSGILTFLWFGERSNLVLDLSVAGLWMALGLVQLKPYVRVSSASIAIGESPAWPYKVIPWSSVQAVSRPRPGAIDLVLDDGKTVTLTLGNVRKSDRAPLVAAVEGHAAPLGRTP